MQALLPWLTLAAGFIVLAWSADRLVIGASALALHLGLAPLLVGLFIIGFGTSIPELLVSALAALDGEPELALGNAIGSNIANVGLILALTLAVFPLARQHAGQGVTVTLLAVATAVTLLLIADRYLGRIEGMALMAGLVGSFAWMLHTSRRGAPAVGVEPDAPAMSRLRSAATIAVALLLLLASARALVWAAVLLAERAGISELVIGLSIVAVGTSLPELATAIAAARRQETGLLYGNLIGSNLFNLLAVLGLAAIISPFALSPEVLLRDGALMALLTIPLILLATGRMTGSRLMGVAMVTLYAGYQGSLYLW
ncbi:sodium:calcium antiporter [Aquisalimonas asiatica]|uniref:Cation:H+ antiporter n=1 Tax=Aquisalimonas asiatica TaxID=406100 RepID=A0A1H8S932_9GAMM|nr:hypothetical protein [Aquisalimonas asiatica]SEO75132.1 cation:H+ antiporter [Aquisalimonas asiatica]